MARKPFWERVQKREDTGCWEWTGFRMPNGYGRVYDPGRKDVIYAHRRSYEITHGPIPNGLWVLHQCDNPSCVNPDHLFLGTAGDNARDRTRKGRQWVASGELSPVAKFKESQIREVHALAMEKSMTLKQIAAKTGVSHASVQSIVNGYCWRHVYDEVHGLVEK